MNFLECWYTAANTPHGACFEVTNYDSVRQQLYTARTAAADPALSHLKIVPSPINPNHLWIIPDDGSRKKPLNVKEIDIEI